LQQQSNVIFWLTEAKNVYLQMLMLLKVMCSLMITGINFWKIRTMIGERRKQHAVKHLSQLGLSPLNPSPDKYDDKYVTQLLDHFNPQNQVTVFFLVFVQDV
jgi:phosphoglycerate-specific signal transduction histidine kinase